MKRIVAFTGPAGSGKDTAGNLLVDFGFYVIKFATPMYQALEIMGFDWPHTQADKERIVPEFGVTWRHAAQTLGTEWGRNLINKDLWALITEKHMLQQFGEDRFAITDLRFENEADMVRRNGGLVIHMLGRRSGTGNDTHASEAGIQFQYDKGDRRVDNSGSLHYLESQLLTLLEERGW